MLTSLEGKYIYIFRTGSYFFSETVKKSLFPIFSPVPHFSVSLSAQIRGIVGLGDSEEVSSGETSEDDRARRKTEAEIVEAAKVILKLFKKSPFLLHIRSVRFASSYEIFFLNKFF